MAPSRGLMGIINAQFCELVCLYKYVCLFPHASHTNRTEWFLCQVETCRHAEWQREGLYVFVVLFFFFYQLGSMEILDTCCIPETRTGGSVALEIMSNSIFLFFIKDYSNDFGRYKMNMLFSVFSLTETNPTCFTWTFSNVPHLLIFWLLLSTVFNVQPHR